MHLRLPFARQQLVCSPTGAGPSPVPTGADALNEERFSWGPGDVFKEEEEKEASKVACRYVRVTSHTLSPRARLS